MLDNAAVSSTVVAAVGTAVVGAGILRTEGWGVTVPLAGALSFLRAFRRHLNPTWLANKS
jgi:hypothetical protein